MAKLSGLIASGKVGQADPHVVAAMPALDTVPAVPEPTLEVTQEAGPPVAPSSPADLRSSAPLPGDRIEDIPLAAIRRSPYQVRGMGSDEYIESLAASIQSSGVISPIVVRSIQNKESSNFELPATAYEFIAGEHRAMACRRLGHTTITAIIRPLSDQQAAIALASDNAVRKPLDDYDRYKHANMLRKSGFCRTDREIGATLGLSHTQISMLRKGYDPMPEEAHLLLDTHPDLLGYAYAYAIHGITATHPDLVVQALHQLVAKKLLPSKVKAWLDAHLRPATVRTARDTIDLRRPGYPDVQLVVTAREAVIRADGIDSEALHALIAANLEKLLPRSK